MGSHSPDRNAFMTLPPEIMDKILEHVSADEDGRRTLIACALVATWWTGPSQRRLFSSVEIDENNYRRWINSVVHSGSKDHLLEYVRSMWHGYGGETETKYRMRDLPQDPGEYFSALRNLHSLTFFSIRIERNRARFHTYFSAFRETLTSLSLDTFSTPFSAFVALVDYFPNITTLLLRLFVLEHDERPVPPLSRPLRGKLRLNHVRAGFSGFLNRFARLNLEYEELLVDTSSLSATAEARFLENSLRISTSTVKVLKLTEELRSETGVSIGDFQQLQELELVATHPRSPNNIYLLSSITSTELRKITFLVKHMRDWIIFAWRMEEWAFTDKALCKLVDRLRAMGYFHTLEVELRITKIGDGPGGYDFTKFLPEFREKGVVTIIVAVNGDRLLHSSAGNH